VEGGGGKYVGHKSEIGKEREAILLNGKIRTCLTSSIVANWTEFKLF
jgi:hypothetical protein